jgi:hypothetical protein
VPIGARTCNSRRADLFSRAPSGELRVPESHESIIKKVSITAQTYVFVYIYGVSKVDLWAPQDNETTKRVL